VSLRPEPCSTKRRATRAPSRGQAAQETTSSAAPRRQPRGVGRGPVGGSRDRRPDQLGRVLPCTSWRGGSPNSGASRCCRARPCRMPRRRREICGWPRHGVPARRSARRHPVGAWQSVHPAALAPERSSVKWTPPPGAACRRAARADRTARRAVVAAAGGAWGAPVEKPVAVDAAVVLDGGLELEGVDRELGRPSGRERAGASGRSGSTFARRSAARGHAGFRARRGTGAPELVLEDDAGVLGGVPAGGTRGRTRGGGRYSSRLAAWSRGARRTPMAAPRTRRRRTEPAISAPDCQRDLRPAVPGRPVLCCDRHAAAAGAAPRPEATAAGTTRAKRRGGVAPLLCDLSWS
jgi:hypothetical protein